jgi:hypothetical protein
MRNDHGLQGAGAPRRLCQQMTVTEQGLLLGDGTFATSQLHHSLGRDRKESPRSTEGFVFPGFRSPKKVALYTRRESRRASRQRARA